MKDKKLDVTLNISNDLSVQLNVYDPVITNTVSTYPCFIDVTLKSNYEPLPSDEDCQPIDVGFSVSDIAGQFDFNVSRDCYTTLNLYADPSVILDVSCEFHWPEDKFPYYEGEYFVDPRKVDQVLSTKEKSMAQDLQVNSIYFSKVINEAGGNTVLIGKE